MPKERQKNMHNHKDSVQKKFLQGLLRLRYICLGAAFCICGALYSCAHSTEITYRQESPETEYIGGASQSTPETIQPQTEGNIYVYVCGQVACPGVYELPIGARAFQAVEMAGGAAQGADMSRVNMADELKDAQMLYIPAVGEYTENLAGGGDSSGDEATDVKVNINTATAEQLMELPGIGEAKAADIIAYRQKNGKFNAIEDIMQVNGIKEAAYARMKDKICVK